MALALPALARAAGPTPAGPTVAAVHPGAPVPRAEGQAVPPAPAKPARSPAVGCLIGPDQLADVGSPVTGVIAQVLVDRGDAVRRGQPLILLEQAVEQAGLQAADARADAAADVRAAEAALELARQKERRQESLTGRGFVSPQAVEQARTERQVAEQRLAQARDQRRVLAQERDVVRAQLGQRTLRSPFDGVVAERFANNGERVDERPLVRVARLDPLRVELVLPATRWGSVRVDDLLLVQPELPGAKPVQAVVTRIDRLIDAASNTFRVRLQLPNPGNRLPAGARCRLEGPAGPDAAAADAPSPAAQRRGGA